MIRRFLDRVTLTDWRGSLDGVPTFWSRTLLEYRGWRVSLHRIVASDDAGCFHTHPAWACRIILAGGYLEEMEDGRHRAWRPGRIGLVRPQLSHRIAGLFHYRGSYSLWIRAPKTNRIHLRGPGWPQALGEP